MEEFLVLLWLFGDVSDEQDFWWPVSEWCEAHTFDLTQEWHYEPMW
jgi:hypothetical protein